MRVNGKGIAYNHPSILLGDFNIITTDLQDKLTNSKPWKLVLYFILPINVVNNK